MGQAHRGHLPGNAETGVPDLDAHSTIIALGEVDHGLCSQSWMTLGFESLHSHTCECVLSFCWGRCMV